MGRAVSPARLSFLQNVLPPEWCAELRADLDWALEHNPNGLNASNSKLILAHRLFETSQANLRLFDVEPIVSLAEALIVPNCHVIHNNSFKTPTGFGIDTWHQDDAPTIWSPKANRPRMCDCRPSSSRPTTTSPMSPNPNMAAPSVIPGSHLFGAPARR
ncbi:MAG: hypothetical protein R3E79_42275 [Caldilineaceae bacterium]